MAYSLDHEPQSVTIYTPNPVVVRNNADHSQEKGEGANPRLFFSPLPDPFEVAQKLCIERWGETVVIDTGMWDREGVLTVRSSLRQRSLPSATPRPAAPRPLHRPARSAPFR